MRNSRLDVALLVKQWWWGVKWGEKHEPNMPDDNKCVAWKQTDWSEEVELPHELVRSGGMDRSVRRWSWLVLNRLQVCEFGQREVCPTLTRRQQGDPTLPPNTSACPLAHFRMLAMPSNPQQGGTLVTQIQCFPPRLEHSEALIMKIIFLYLGPEQKCSPPPTSTPKVSVSFK